MSSIADFRLIEIEKLGALRINAKPQKGFLGKVKDNFYSYLDQNTKSLKEYTWSGYIYATLLEYLNEKGINFEESEYSELTTYLNDVRSSYYLIFTKSHKEKYIRELNLANFDESELASYYNDFNETDDEAAGKAMLDGIGVLQHNLNMVDEKTVIIFGI